jgi:hypothetical protein
MYRSLLSVPPLLMLATLAACDRDPNGSGGEFKANRVVARVQKEGEAQQLKLDVPLQGMQVTSVLSASRAFTLLIGGDPEAMEPDQAEPMMQLLVNGPLAVRGYPVLSVDFEAENPLPPGGEPAALGLVAAREPDGDDTDLFVTTGGALDVVEVRAPEASPLGRVRARVDLKLRELSMTTGTLGKPATGKGTLDGPVLQLPGSDAELSFTGAFAGSTVPDLLRSAFDFEPGAWSFSAQGGTTMADFYLRLARIPRAGETVALRFVAPDTLRGTLGSDTASSALLGVYGRELQTSGGVFLSTSGELRVESADASSVRGTLTVTLTEYDFATEKLGTRTVTATGRVGLVTQAASPFFSRAPAVRARLAPPARWIRGPRR